MTGKLNGPAMAEWRQHWKVVAAAGAGISLATVHAYSIGVMIAPLEKEFGWSRAEISSGPSVAATIGGLFSPFMGLAIDKFGARRIGVFGVFAVCAALMGLSTTTNNIWTWWSLWIVVAAATLFAKPTVWAAGVSSLFDSGRGFALAATLSASGLGSALSPLIAYHLIEHFGWRGAYIGLALIWGFIAIPLVLLFFTSASDRRRTDKSAIVSKRAIGPGLTPKQGLTSFVFLKLCIAAVALSIAATSCMTNIVPILSFTGIGRATAVEIAGVAGISTVIGRLSGGLLLDRFNAGRVAAVCAASPILSCLLLIAFPGNVPASIAAVFILGVAFGSEYDAVAYLTSRLFGMRSFGTLFGTIMGLLIFAGGQGPLLANFVYDRTGSYFPVLWGFIPIALLSSTLFLCLGPYPSFEAPKDEGDPLEAGLSANPASVQ